MASPRFYRPSWVNSLLSWINSLPFHPIIFYIGFYALSVLVVHLALWADGSLTQGDLLSTVFFDMVWIPFGLGYVHFMESIAASSIQEFRPALRASKSDFDAIQYRFLTLPFWPTLIISLFGFAVGVYVVYATLQNANTDISKLPWSILAGGGYTFLPILLYAAARHIRQIRQLYGRVTELNLFDLQPLYGLARVAMTAGAFMVVLANLNFAWELFLGTPSMNFETTVLVSIVALVVTLVVVLIPLWGIHSKIDDEKRSLLADNAAQIKDLHKVLETDLRKKKFANLDSIQKGLDALFTMRTNIKDVPAWPWRPGAFRNFASAILLPLLLVALQRLLLQFF
jgi:hypothetical protein